MDPQTQVKLLNKIGGRFKLVSLVQKRQRELMRGLPALVEGPPHDLWRIVTEEILTDKVQLITGDEAERIRKEQAARETEGSPALGNKGAAAEEKDKTKEKERKGD
jgi:DNA-directed RNA polymerase subunit omega